MKLFYSPGACSLGIHVILEELGAPFETQVVNTRAGDQHRPEYLALNPKAKVPAIQRGDGSVLTEFPVIATWLAKSNPQAALIPTDLEGETRCAELLDYICGTVHPQGFTRQFRAGLFTPNPEDEPKVVEQGKALAAKYFGLLDAHWGGGTWALPSGYSVADAALFFVEYWAAKRSGMALPPHLAAHLAAMLARPAVQRALATEGLPA